MMWKARLRNWISTCCESRTMVMMKQWRRQASLERCYCRTIIQVLKSIIFPSKTPWKRESAHPRRKIGSSSYSMIVRSHFSDQDPSSSCGVVTGRIIIPSTTLHLRIIATLPCSGFGIRGPYRVLAGKTKKRTFLNGSQKFSHFASCDRMTRHHLSKMASMSRPSVA